jgi:hypothetical protein
MQAKDQVRDYYVPYRSFKATYLHNIGLNSFLLRSNNVAKLLSSFVRTFRNIATLRRRMCARNLGAL